MPSPVKSTIKTELPAILIIILSVVLSIFFYYKLPEVVVTHWSLAGEPNGWMSRLWASVMLPAMTIGIYLMFLGLPYLDPKKERYANFAKIYHIFKNVILLFLVLILIISNLNNLGYNLPVNIYIPGLIGILFVIMGNYFGKIKQNWFMGIRTPWTLSSNEVWNKTHRMGGKLFILGGVLIAVSGIAPITWRLPLFILAITILVVGTFGYSYFVYYNEKKHNNKK